MQPMRTLLLFGLVCLAAPTAGLSQSNPPNSIDEGQSCLDSACHDDLATKRTIHKPASKATTCKFCHQAAEPEQHQFQLANKKTEICLKCHKMVKDEKSQHMPAKRGMCLNCHDPHQSDNRFLLTKRPAGDLCKGCHRKILTAETKTQHGPVQDANCTGCHDPHASNNKKLLKDTEPDLCLNCHNRPLTTDDGDRLPSIKQIFEDESLDQHKPFQTGRCSMCHVAHGSDNHRLLKSAYPESFYTSYDKEKYFCFRCHKASAFEAPRTLTLTGVRNGNLNLHYRHVNKEKGRTCRACHDHHAGDFDKLIRRNIPFGSRSIQISEFTLTETGGTCGPTCHLPLSYDRWNPVDPGIKTSPREGVDATAEELATARATQDE